MESFPWCFLTKVFQPFIWCHQLRCCIATLPDLHVFFYGDLQIYLNLFFIFQSCKPTKQNKKRVYVSEFFPLDFFFTMTASETFICGIKSDSLVSLPWKRQPCHHFNKNTSYEERRPPEWRCRQFSQRVKSVNERISSSQMEPDFPDVRRFCSDFQEESSEETCFTKAALFPSPCFMVPHQNFGLKSVF